jgi:hypothetical protein
VHHGGSADDGGVLTGITESGAAGDGHRASNRLIETWL